jgi:hypothetical protein
MAVSELPPGFVLDQPADTGLPPGFVMDKPGYAEDAAKSIGSGLASATAGTLGAAGDARSALSAATDWAGGKLGVSPDKVQQFKDLASRAASMTGPGAMLANAPTSRQVIDSAPNPIISPDYQPQTVAGGYLKTGAEFLPNMLVGGPRGLGARFLTDVAVPAIASETAGLATKGTEAEPYARMGGALLGAVGANKAANAFSEARAVKAATPSLADVKSEASNSYDALTSRNVATPLAQSTLDNLADDIRTALNNKGIRPSNAKSIHDAVDELRTPGTAGAADVADLVAVRQNIKEQLGKHDTNKSGAFVALDKIEKAIEANSPGTMVKLKEADQNWGAFRTNETLDKKLARAELRASGEHSGLNLGNKMRQKVADLLLSNDAKYLSAETKKDLEKFVKGTFTQNTLRAVSNALGGGGGVMSTMLGVAGSAGGAYSGHPELAALPFLGIGMRMGANRAVSNQASRVAQGIRARSPLGQQTAPILPPKSSASLAALRAALLSRPIP